MEKALDSTSQPCWDHEKHFLTWLTSFLSGFLRAFYKPQSHQPKLSWRRAAPRASSSKNTVSFEELFLKIRMKETPQGL